MEIQVPPFMEKRQFGRITISEPQVCQVHVPKSQELWVHQGIIRNICLEGIYFVCDEEPPLDKDDIRHLTFDVIYNDQKIYRLKFYGLVVRTEDDLLDRSQVAIAFKFLSDPIYQPFKEINYSEFPFPDKTRIMYQYYQLNRKAQEIIKKTPDVRAEKIKEVKERIDQDLYDVDTTKLAQGFTKTILRENIVLVKK
jgi:hypothetical protein